MPARVRTGARYVYRPVVIDLIDPKTTLVPGEPVHAHVAGVYGRTHARKVVRAAMADYAAAFGA